MICLELFKSEKNVTTLQGAYFHIIELYIITNMLGRSSLIYKCEAFINNYYITLIRLLFFIPIIANRYISYL